MVERPDVVFLGGLDFFSAAVARLATSDWDRPSPCEGWRARDVLGHVGSAVGFGTKLLRDDRPVWEPLEPPGAAVEGDPDSWWETLVGPAREALSGVELSRGVIDPIPAEQVRSQRVFASEVAPPPDATPTQRFIAWTGRDPRWAPVP